MGAVQDHLVTGVGMHGGHDAALDGEGVVQGLSHGSQAVGGAGRGGDDLVVLGQGFVIHVVHNGLQVLAGGRGDDNLLGASGDVGHGLFLGAVEAGALQHHIHVQGAPGAVGSVLLSVDLDFLAVHDDGVLGGLHGVEILADTAAVGALRGVVLQQVGQHGGRGQVVDGDDFVALSAEHLTESKTADTAEAIDSNLNSHWMIPPCIWSRIVPYTILPNFALFCNRVYAFS